MEIVDAQMHLLLKRSGRYAGGPVRPVVGVDAWPAEAALAAMEAVGVDAALVDSNHLVEQPDGSWVPDNSYAAGVAANWPGVFGAIAILTVDAPDIDEQVAAAKQNGFLGLRCFVRTRAELAQYDSGAYDAFLAAAQRYSMPVMCLMFRHLSTALDIAGRYPNLRFVIDHIGMPQPPWRLDDPVFADLPRMLELARHDNVAVRLVGAPTYSSQAYPYRDVWSALHPLIGAYGCERLMWGSDLTRLFGALTYAQLLGYLLYTDEIGPNEKEQLLGRSIRTLLAWAPPPTRPPRDGWVFSADNPPLWLEN